MFSFHVLLIMMLQFHQIKQVFCLSIYYLKISEEVAKKCREKDILIAEVRELILKPLERPTTVGRLGWSINNF
jgi:hypothetical protein